MENGKLLIVTVGLPRSGKSTFATSSHEYPIVNPDSIRLAIHGERYILQAEPWVWTVTKTMVEALFLAGHNYVILDATNTTRRQRDNWISKKWETIFHYVDVTAEECIKRAEEENDTEIIPIIQRMSDEFEPLEDDEKRYLV